MTPIAHGREIKFSTSAAVFTDWYDADQLPARSGVYEVEVVPGASDFRYCNGQTWYHGGTTPREALFQFQYVGEIATVAHRWRGLSEKP